MSDDTKQKLSLLRTGKTGKCHSPETIRKMREAWVRRKADSETYAAYIQATSERMSTPEAKKRMRDRTAKLIQDGNHNGKSRDTAPEIKFKRYLDEQNIVYEHQFVINTRKGSFTFDFYAPSLHLLIEVDGEYWHRKSLEVWNRDKLKQHLATDLGYIVARISDKNWHPEIIFGNHDAIRSHSNALLEQRYQAIMARKAV